MAMKVKLKPRNANRANTNRATANSGNTILWCSYCHHPIPKDTMDCSTCPTWKTLPNLERFLKYISEMKKYDADPLAHQRSDCIVEMDASFNIKIHTLNEFAQKYPAEMEYVSYALGEGSCVVYMQLDGIMVISAI